MNKKYIIQKEEAKVQNAFNVGILLKFKFLTEFEINSFKFYFKGFFVQYKM